MRPLAVVFVALLASSCSRCGAGRSADAGVDAGRPNAVTRRSVDLRTALLYVYPEYRGTATLSVEGHVTRTIPGLTDAQRDEALKKLRYVAAEDGGWRLANFHLSQLGPEQLRVSLEWNVDQLATLYVSPTALTSMELAMYLPRELPVGDEEFVFEVHYASSPERSASLVRQAVNLLLGNGQFKAQGPVPPPPDAGALPVVEEETATVLGPEGAVVTFHRKGGQVWARYVLAMVKP
ncbi:MAG: hypothetical protein ACOZQL_08155 [Myxococcota bacterium]